MPLEKALQPSSAAVGRMLTNEQTSQPTNQQTNTLTNKHDGSQYLLPEAINMQMKYAANLRFWVWRRHRVVFIRGLPLLLAELTILGLCKEYVGRANMTVYQ